MPNLIVISGTSGAGKSSALRQLEDEGFYCVDNLPPRLLPNFLDEVLSHRGYETFRGIGVCIDARAVKDESDQRSLKTSHLLEVRGGLLVFLDAKPHILLQRFSETRRRHPLASSDNSLTEAIKREKKMLEPIAAIADLLIDTSDLTTTNLREIINERVMRERAG